MLNRVELCQHELQTQQDKDVRNSNRNPTRANQLETPLHGCIFDSRFVSIVSLSCDVSFAVRLALQLFQLLLCLFLAN